MKANICLYIANLIFIDYALFGQTNQGLTSVFPYSLLNDSNVVISVADLWGSGQHCPVEYTNILSNTNLFTFTEEQLLGGVLAKYNHVTPNAGPSGTILTGLQQTNLLAGNKIIRQWIASYTYTNYDAREEIRFGPNLLFSKFRYDSGGGYNVSITQTPARDSLLKFAQFENGRPNGLHVEFLDNHLQEYRHSTNGMLIGKFFAWNPKNGNIVIEAQFEKPYDIEKHEIH